MSPDYQDDSSGWVGFVDVPGSLWDDYQVLCPCCQRPAQLEKVLEETT